MDITNFSPEQLNMLQKQLSEEFQLIQNSYASLKALHLPRFAFVLYSLPLLLRPLMAVVLW